jgi:cytochrome d ubiquinol oxidase subunit II
MLYVVLFFAIFSFFLYVLLGGADFGAGIIELFSSTQNQKPIKNTVYNVMGPVWEANHIWIIILIVIMWIAFPVYYNIVVVYLHIPLTLVLLGITLRGAAFIFRHYDAVKGESQKLYDRLFRISCMITPIFLGMVFGALVTGDIALLENNPNADFYDLYVHPWLQLFPFVIGLFYAALCTFLASVFLIGEAIEEEKKMYIRKATIATIAVVTLGFVVLVTGFAEGRSFITNFIENPFAIISVIFSGIILYPLWRAIRIGRIIRCRIFAGLQVVLILFAALVTHIPNIISTTAGPVNFLDGIAPKSVIRVLGISLLIGGSLILPGLVHLLKSFRMIKMLDDDTRR